MFRVPSRYIQTGSPVSYTHLDVYKRQGVDITDNKLELISPYRADAYGIEFLAQKRGKNTTDNESDNDVFFVGAADSILTSGVMCYKLIRTGWNISGVLNPDKMFNVMYNQRAMLLANSKYIGISADKLEDVYKRQVLIRAVRRSWVMLVNTRLSCMPVKHG